ncbi:hypothetical protein VOLCADRAFT_97156 [Volvox carteri f. nagariensis]|uniref:Nucleotide-diphospho-sugar transferase domain-containing protein n=1 Tax=Volvox carteri f. nagariensis TaxID=3068 RepID=D8UC10_VOLCA|nr:uncharacterized protein VOLCADRAFT_97156 [Volvox carteri f. nagariensis]EFJ42765.1 hypothetical protein VOLCADRAFT_97156 [Volvox carteri f. nagariensis]|eukprot:XP_002956226.1 hypothetical protein VOLCADRAFT_97156 [Volvox carteri f. nagariensis]
MPQWGYWAVVVLQLCAQMKCPAAERPHTDDHRLVAHNRMNWHAVWAAAKAAGSEAEFLAAMRASAQGGADNVLRGVTHGLTAPSLMEVSHGLSPSTSITTASAAATGAGQDQAKGSPSSLPQQQQQQQPSWKSFVVDGQAPQISKELAQSVARGGAVIVTWANFALWDFVKTWISHTKEVGLDNFLVGAMDAQIGSELVAAGVPCFAMYSGGSNHSGVGADHLQWGGEAFHKMVGARDGGVGWRGLEGRQKITLAQLFLGLGLDLLLVDVDVMLLGDVMEYFGRYPQADILVTSDQLASTLEPGDAGLEMPEQAQAPMNIGLMFFRYSDRTVTFVDSWLAAINADPQYWDQNAFNDLARQGWDPVNKVHPNQKRVFMGANGTLAVGVLPVASFSGGHTYYVQRLYEGGHLLRSWHAHSALGRGERDDLFVSVELRRVPSATWSEHSAKNNSAMKRYHFRGLDLQLEAVRWREHSFLENPRCPGWVKRSRVTFYSKPGISQPMEKYVVQEGGLVVVLPANLTERALREVLKPYWAIKVWHIKDPENFFGGFDDKTLGEAVESRIKHLVPVMPPDPSPPPPPTANSTTADGAALAQTGGGADAGTAATGSSTNTGSAASARRLGRARKRSRTQMVQFSVSFVRAIVPSPLAPSLKRPRPE